jgi:hypothetical protein
MIYSYNRSQQDTLFLNFSFDRQLYMFRTDLLSIIRSLDTVFTAIGVCHTIYIDCLLAVSQHVLTIYTIHKFSLVVSTINIHPV